jgi:hypothetical protein
MSKYIPKVGEAFQFYSDTFGYWVQCGKVIAETHTEIAYLYESNGEIRTLKKDRRFFPIQTKSAVEREQLTRLIANSYNKNTGFEACAKSIQQAGFTIPKKIKRSDIDKILHKHFDQDDVSITMKHILINEFCDLLGDLVEQDDKGGAE